MVFAIHWHESAMDLHVFPIWSPLPPPSPHDPSGSFQCTSPEHLSHASSLGWWSVKLIFIVDFISENLVLTSAAHMLKYIWKSCQIFISSNICWAVLFDFLCRQSYHLEIMRIVYSLSSFLSFKFFSIVLCSRTASIRLSTNYNSMPSCIAS